MRKTFYRLDIDNKLVRDREMREKYKASLYDCIIDLDTRTVRLPKVTYLQSMTEWIDARAIIEGKVKEKDKALVEKVLEEWSRRMRELISLKWNKLACLDRASGWIADNSLAGTAKCNLKIQIGSGGVKFAY